jgi:hypothetical protein
MDEPAIEQQARDILSPLWFAVTLAVFIGLGLALKTRILNWIYGPLFPLFFLYLVPTAAKWACDVPRRRRERRMGDAPVNG